MLQWLCDNLDLPMLTERADDAFEANPAARARLSGRETGDLVTAVRLLTENGVDMAELASLLDQARAGEPASLETASGDRLLLNQVSPGRALVVLAPEDLTTNASLRRRAAIADHTAGVSHELANALGAIAGWAQLAREGKRVDEALELIEKSAETAWSAARHMLNDVSRGGQELPRTPMDMSKFVNDAARLLAPKAMRHDVQVRCNIAPDVTVEGDRGSLWSIVWNLAANAVEAMPSGGTVELQLKRVDGMAVLTVIDNGPGMPAQVRERVFEPYFTTKGSGTGLGLSMVKNAAENLGGQIAFHSDTGQGTSFQVTLPLCMEPVRSERPGAKHTSGVFMTEQLGGRYLLVEDDAALREMVSTALAMRGAEVVAVPDAAAARALAGPFTAAMVDLLLPDQRGDQLIADLRNAGTVQHAILATGTELPNSIAAGGAPDAVLRKPFELDSLFESLRDVLNLVQEGAVGH